MRQIKKIIIHCSDTPSSWTGGAAEIRRWHVEDNGWIDIGYHYVVRRDGQVEKGRKEHTIGAHCRGQNDCSIGIVWVGGKGMDGKPCDNRTAIQRHNLRHLIEKLLEKHPQATVHGHSEFSIKTCPNFNVKEEFKTLGATPI